MSLCLTFSDSYDIDESSRIDILYVRVCVCVLKYCSVMFFSFYPSRNIFLHFP